MNGFEKFIYALQAEMTTPTNYSLFHLVAIALVIVSTIAVCLLLKNAKQKTFRIFVFVCWLVILILEVYKQVVFSFGYDGSIAVWDYEWYAFPFQLCSVQLYLLPFVVFLKDGKVRDAIIAFLSIFSFFGGFVVYLCPNDVFISMIGINIQTMVHHGLQILLGIFFIVYNRKKLSFKYFLSSIAVFVVCIGVAMALNFIVPNFTDETFNMFYISPKFECTLPVLSIIYPKVPYIVFLLLYIVGFSIVELIIFLIFYAIAKLLSPVRLSKANKPKLILSLIFTLAEIALLVLILFFDTGATRYLEFAGIALAGLFPLVFLNPNKNAFSINIGLILTIFADIFLVLIKNTNPDIGMVFFLLAQLCYFLFLFSNTESKAQRISNVVTRLVLMAGIITACIIVLKDKVDFLSIISVIYFANLLTNLVFAYIGGKKSLAFAIGLTLFILCDVIIGLQVASDSYLTISENSIIHKVLSADFNIAWACYLPSQVIIALFSIYSNSYSSSLVQPEILAISSKEDALPIEVSGGKTAIVNTNSKNIKIVRKDKGKPATEINITTNNIPVVVAPQKTENDKKVSNKKKEKTAKSKNKTSKNNKIVAKEEPKVQKEEITQTTKAKPETAENKNSTSSKKTPAKNSAGRPKKLSNNKPKMVVRNKIRKFETFRQD